MDIQKKKNDITLVSHKLVLLSQAHQFESVSMGLSIALYECKYPECKCVITVQTMTPNGNNSIRKGRKPRKS
jgi:hypothetical protein